METIIATISTKIFNGLVDNCKAEDESTLEQVAFRSHYTWYGMSFYANIDDNYNLMVEDFGRNVKGVWQQHEPTEEQLNWMRQKIDAEVMRLQGERTIEVMEEYEDPYKTFGVSRADFF